MSRLKIINLSALIGFIITIILLASCNSKPLKVDSAFKKSLIEKNIKGTNYYISLPDKYIIKESRGIDFSVYYFHAADTTNKISFSGGFYLGNAPGSFDMDTICKAGKIKSTLLGINQDWSLYTCTNKYKIQIITDSKSGYDWGLYIHAFGSGSSRIELNKLLDVYSTLKLKKSSR